MLCPQGRMRKSLNDNQRTAQVSDSENDNQGRLVSLTQKMIQKIALQALKKKKKLALINTWHMAPLQILSLFIYFLCPILTSKTYPGIL